METEYVLRSCLWELTLRCNMKCVHCGSVAGKAREWELSEAECYHTADELLALGCENLTLIGGEIFLYAGWERIARYLSDRGVLVNIMTNGYGISEYEIQQICDAQLTNVGISLDGMAEHHNGIRRRRDSFAHIQRAFDLLNGKNIPIAVVTSLMELNYPDLEEMYEYLVRNGVELWQLQLVNPMGHMADRRDGILRPERIPALIEFIREKNVDHNMSLVAADNIGYCDEHEESIRGRRSSVSYWVGCQAGMTSVFIDSVGNVKGCGALYDDAFIEGNIRTRLLSEIWNDNGSFSYNRGFDVQQLAGTCKGCDVGGECKGGCRASNFFNTHSLFESAYCTRHVAEIEARRSETHELPVSMPLS